MSDSFLIRDIASLFDGEVYDVTASEIEIRFKYIQDAYNFSSYMKERSDKWKVSISKAITSFYEPVYILVKSFD